MMIKELIAKLVGWERVRESNWTKANRQLTANERFVVINKAQQDLKKEWESVAEKKRREKEEEKKDTKNTEEEAKIAA